MYADGALRTIYHFNNPFPRSKVVHWLTEAKSEPPAAGPENLLPERLCCSVSPPAGAHSQRDRLSGVPVGRSPPGVGSVWGGLGVL